MDRLSIFEKIQFYVQGTLWYILMLTKDNIISLFKSQWPKT